MGFVAFLYSSSKIALEFLATVPFRSVPQPTPPDAVSSAMSPRPLTLHLPPSLVLDFGQETSLEPERSLHCSLIFFQSKFSNINYTLNYFSRPRAVNHSLRGC